MKTNTHRVFILSILFSIPIQAQYTLEYDYNQLRDGDCLDKIQIPYVEPGEKGYNVLWQYDNTHYNTRNYRQTYRITGDSMLCIEHETEYLYFMKGDTIFLKSFENRTTRFLYEVPRIVQTYPFQYGDSIYGEYAGTGIYGEKLHLRVIGTNYTVADGWGILLNGEDTLEHILRVHKHSEFFQWNALDSALIADAQSQLTDSSTLKMVEDRYLWYRIGSRYPILESIKSCSVIDGVEKPHFSTSFLFLPAAQTYGLNTDLKNENRLKELSNTPLTKEPFSKRETLPIKITALLNSDGKSLSISYTLDSDMSLSFNAYDSVGRLLATASYTNHAAGIYNEILTLASTPIGDVILLYVNQGTTEQLIKIQF